MKLKAGLLALTAISSCQAIAPQTGSAQTGSRMEALISDIEPDVINWRRDIHQNPELSNREFRTAGLVADHLRLLGLEVKTDIAITGVVGILRGPRPGPTIALRADMDALPIPEQTGLPFASTTKSEFGFATVPVMHACGHDAHTAILMGTASVLSEMKDELAGTVIFVFQPAEEGAPVGEFGGAERMLAEGVFDDLKPEAMFALHVEPGPVGRVYTRPDGFLAGSSALHISLSGAGTHAAKPWSGSDLPSLGADIIKAMSVIGARRIDVLKEPSVISLARIEIGARSNVLPDTGEMFGTVRIYSEERLAQVKAEIERAVSGLATIYDAGATVQYGDETPPTVNNANLLHKILPSLENAAGETGVDAESTRRAAAEDFSYFARQVPSVYYILGSTKNFESFETAPSNHSPQFDIDEDVLAIGVRTQVQIALDYLDGK
jgi:amidohydrolase